MAVQLNSLLPEIMMEDFHSAWTHFELMLTAKAWNPKKQRSSCQPGYVES